MFVEKFEPRGSKSPRRGLDGHAMARGQDARIDHAKRGFPEAFMKTRPASRLLALAGALLLMTSANAFSQAVDCNRLRSQIAAASRGDPGKAASYHRAVDRQRAEIDRTVAYGRSLGCEHQQFLFFGQAPPPQCGTINAQISRMNANLQSLEEQAAHASGGNEDVRRDLMERYNANCSPAGRNQPDPPRQRGLFDFLFNPDPQPPAQDVDVPPPEPDQRPAEDQDVSRGGPKAVCVRTCDGGFFPVSYSARRSNLEQLSQLCHALCPNAEVQLYTYSISRDIDTAVSMDGSPYSELPAAGKFEKTFDPACTCRPPGKSWVDTLAEAESMLRNGKTDVIVTPEKAAEMSRPLPGKAASLKTPVVDAPAPPPVQDPSAAEGVLAAQVPTASKDSAGIAVGDTRDSTKYAIGQGETRIVTGPDGVKRRVRIVAPNL
jgi:hypothetical protein